MGGTTTNINNDSAISCTSNLPARYTTKANTIIETKGSTTQGMRLIKGGEFLMGASDKEGRPDEYPQHRMKLDDFWIDATEVTNAQFKRFTDATGYTTTAEKNVDWEELKKQLPAGTLKPDDSLLVAASLIFTPPNKLVSLDNVSQWWTWKKGANWRHPQGPGSTINGKEEFR